MMKFFVVALIVISAIFVGVYFIGYTLDPVRSGTSSTECEVSAKELLATVLDVESQPKWRKNVTSVQRANEASSWLEKTKQGEEITFNVLDSKDKSVSMTFVSNRGYSGKWSADLVEYGATRTKITVKEEVTVEGPIGRVISRLFFNTEAFASKYLSELCSETRSRASKGK
jgi:hypothetical protein